MDPSIKTPKRLKTEIIENFSSELSCDELGYLSTLKTEQQYQLAKKMNMSIQPAAMSKPLRFSVLECDAPKILKNQMMQALLTDRHNPKTIQWVDTILKFPWKTTLPSNNDVTTSKGMNSFQQKLDKAIFGHAEVKKLLLNEIVIQQVMGDGAKFRPPIALCGAPGNGKTSLARAVAESLGRPLSVINLGGANDPAHLAGHAFTYEGSRMGQIAQVYMNQKCNNPVIVFDELDKINDTINGVTGQLIHLADPACHGFYDRYLGANVDTSKSLIIFTLNNKENVNPILLDRLKIIDVSDFTPDEKKEMIGSHLLKQVTKTLPFKTPVSIDSEAQQILASQAEQGIRSLKKLIDRVVLEKFISSIGKDAIQKSGKKKRKRLVIEKKDVLDITKENENKKNPPVPHMYT